MKAIVCSGLLALTLLSTARAADTTQPQATTLQPHGVGHKVLSDMKPVAAWPPARPTPP